MEAIKMLELLGNGSIHVQDKYEHTYRISHTCGDKMIYFWIITPGFNSTYESYSVYDDKGQIAHDVLVKLDSIVRIDKMIDSEYYPIWTIDCGEIIQNDKFVKLNGQFYTIKYLEDLIETVNLQK